MISGLEGYEAAARHARLHLVGAFDVPLASFVPETEEMEVIGILENFCRQIRVRTGDSLLKGGDGSSLAEMQFVLDLYFERCAGQPSRTVRHKPANGRYQGEFVEPVIGIEPMDIEARNHLAICRFGPGISLSVESDGPGPSFHIPTRSVPANHNA